MTVDMTTDALKRLAADNRDDPQYLAALGLMVLTGRTATSLVQRALGIGYNAAARIVERIEADGIISRPNSAGKRELIERREADAPVTAREAVPSALRYVPTVTTDNCRTPPLPSETVAEAAEIERLTKARDNLSRLEQSHREQANEQFHRAEKAEAEIERLKVKLQARDGECKGKAEIIAQLEAERDEARAQVAMAYEVAIDKAECCLLCQDDIRALTSADAKSALEAYGREKVLEGMKRVIVRLRHEGHINPSLTYADAIEWAEYVLAQMEALK